MARNKDKEKTYSKQLRLDHLARLWYI